MSTPPRVTVSFASVGRVLLLAGAIIVLLAALNVLQPRDNLNWFELGVGLAFLGIGLG